MFVSLDNNNMKKEGSDMDKIKKTTMVVIGSILETVWAIGVGIIVGQLST